MKTIQSDESNFKSEIMFETKNTKSSEPNQKSNAVKSY